MDSSYVPFQLLDADEFEALEVAIAAAERSSYKKSKLSISSCLTGSSYSHCSDTSSAALCETPGPGPYTSVSATNKLACAPHLHNSGFKTAIGAAENLQASYDSLLAAKGGQESSPKVAFGNGYLQRDEFHEHSEYEPSRGLSSRPEDEGDVRFSESATGEGERAYLGDSTNAYVYSHRDANILVLHSDNNLLKAPCSSSLGLPSETVEATTASHDETHSDKPTSRRLPSWQSYAGTYRCESSRPAEHTKVNQTLRSGDEEAQVASSSNFPEASSVDNNSLPWEFAPATCRVAVAPKRKLPTFQFKGRINYSVTISDAENAAHELLRQVEAKKAAAGNLVALGFDTEWKVVFKRGAQPRKVAVLQLCIDADRCDVFHVIHTDVPPPLRDILEDPLVSKVGIGAYGDAAKLCRDYSIKVKGVKDLSGLANSKLAGAAYMNKSWSLASLAEELLGKKVDKDGSIRMGDWEVEELSEAQLQYAATDAYASLYLFQVLSTFPDPRKEVLGEVSCKS